MSGDRVDVLEAFDDLRQFAHPHLTAIEDFARFSNARARIAELIEAAEPFVKMDGGEYTGEYISVRLRMIDIRRFGAALRACREGGEE
jgi:hypothetical protein